MRHKCTASAHILASLLSIHELNQLCRYLLEIRYNDLVACGLLTLSRWHEFHGKLNQSCIEQLDDYNALASSEFDEDDEECEHEFEQSIRLVMQQFIAEFRRYLQTNSS